MQDELGDRMKSMEKIYTSEIFKSVNPAYLSSPVYARIDGRGFSKFTKNMVRPFDADMHEAMCRTTEYLVDKMHAAVGYTQSDEISLGWFHPDDLLFGSKQQKNISILASLATAKFISEISKLKSVDLIDKIPHFDSRVFTLPDIDELSNAFVWRFQDARRNAVSMTAHHYFSHKKLQGKSTGEMKAMLEAIDKKFENQAIEFQFGTFIFKKFVLLDSPNSPSGKVQRLRPIRRSFDFLSIPHPERVELIAVV